MLSALWALNDALIQRCIDMTFLQVLMLSENRCWQKSEACQHNMQLHNSQLDSTANVQCAFPQVLLMLPVRWDALKESNLANTVYKGGVLTHPSKGVKALAESLCKQWSDAAPNKKPR